ncbi:MULTISPECIES: 4-(cytidine 5'-diphospho)-2-C-methyl-D-erythritol kinase [unclassified Chelatococcus]|uniref:4-(cytidine 5'-diphospho)-2-C-methyl-D-erythritol kinase n=1 Tax=unclassified Chelatococcus TaxID=2638111 RepID=UPI001BCCA5AC|nr:MULTISPECIES: 4-(cytidine 5'-diphospho)-2-C-methyl-D-erythritol kinase [unclassified Chelatococcus]MBS7698280.1 4-(cytidine 5'-diphospho)-2-C-methyl-D-erythritol kinase [Chelatococcus sp. YT9]MBX3559138.1 4-(cytidine 5'-diphospho)-2-C-methyl-D-erythritol kinase [Chelatococcus sp.]
MAARGEISRGNGRLETRAPAKINLTLHVTGRRADGYHALESLVVFAGVGDHLSFTPEDELALSLSGPRAAGIGNGADNLVLKAARALAERVPGLVLGRFHLAKRLPIASGIGGGSADAAAALRLIATHNGLQLSDDRLMAAARATGADVPVCLGSEARMMSGAGEDLGPPLALPPLFAVMVNPGVAVETASVFRGLGLKPGELRCGATHPDLAAATCGATNARAELGAALLAARNDLEPPARVVAPIIDVVMNQLRAQRGCWLTRMSGSGATVFGLFDDCHAAAAARQAIAAAEPGWWVKATVFR